MQWLELVTLLYRRRIIPLIQMNYSEKCLSKVLRSNWIYHHYYIIKWRQSHVWALFKWRLSSRPRTSWPLLKSWPFHYHLNIDVELITDSCQMQPIKMLKLWPIIRNTMYNLTRIMYDINKCVKKIMYYTWMYYLFVFYELSIQWVSFSELQWTSNRIWVATRIYFDESLSLNFEIDRVYSIFFFWLNSRRGVEARGNHLGITCWIRRTGRVARTSSASLKICRSMRDSS